MSEFIIWVPLVAVVAVAVWFLTRRRKESQVDPAFFTSLDNFGTQVQECSLHLTATTDRAEEAMRATLAFLDELPPETSEDVNNLRVMWEDMAHQISTFHDQPTQSTLQSSILSTRIHKHKDAIHNLIRQIHERHR